MGYLGNCSVPVESIGKKLCLSGNPLKMAQLLVLATPSQQFDTKDDFQDESVWLAQIAAGNLFVLEQVEDVEDTSVEKIEVTTASGRKKKQKDGQRGAMYKMDLDPDQNRKFQGYGNVNWKVYIIDASNNIPATSPDGTIVQGLSTSYFSVDPVTFPTGADILAQTNVEIQLENWQEYDLNGVTALGTDLAANGFIPTLLTPLSTVTISDVSIAAEVITASFNTVSSAIASSPSKPYRGLAEADLSIFEQAGGSVVIGTITETATEGTYTIAVTGSPMTEGTIQLVASANSLFSSAVTVVPA